MIYLDYFFLFTINKKGYFVHVVEVFEKYLKYAFESESNNEPIYITNTSKNFPLS